MLDSIRNTFQRGSLWRRQLAAEDRVAAILGTLLDDQYHLIRNVVLPGDRYDLDMILVGPAGVWEFEILHLVGLVFAEQGWMHWDYNQQGLRPVPRDLGQRVQGKLTQLGNYLAARGMAPQDLNQAIILATPKAPLEFTLPEVQVVLADDLQGFVHAMVNVLHASSTVPVQTLVEHLVRVEAAEDATYVAEKYWGMTPREVLVILVLGALDLGLLVTFGIVALLYNF